MKNKNPFKIITPRKIIKDSKRSIEVHSRDVKMWSDFLRKNKKEPSINSVLEILRNYKPHPELRLSMISSFNEIISSKKKEWPEVHKKWNLFLTLEDIHRKNK